MLKKIGVYVLVVVTLASVISYVALGVKTNRLANKINDLTDLLATQGSQISKLTDERDQLRVERDSHNRRLVEQEVLIALHEMRIEADTGNARKMLSHYSLRVPHQAGSDFGKKWQGSLRLDNGQTIYLKFGGLGDIWRASIPNEVIRLPHEVTISPIGNDVKGPFYHFRAALPLGFPHEFSRIRYVPTEGPE